MFETQTHTLESCAMERFNHEVQRALQRRQQWEATFVERSALVNRQTFAAVAGFPLHDGEIRLQGVDGQRCMEVLQGQLNCFLAVDREYGGRCGETWPHYLASAFPMMQGWTLRTMLQALWVRAMHHRAEGRAELAYIEYVCGKGNLSRAGIQAGYVGVSFDKDISPCHDVLEEGGLELWLLALTAAEPGALIWCGMPCSSYVTLSRSQSLRYPENLHLGDTTKYFVQEGNVLGDITAMIMLLSHLLGCSEAMEQPASSVYPETPCCQAVLRFIGAVKTTTYHYCFGGVTLKPLQLWSSSRFMRALERGRPRCADGATEQLAKRDKDGGFTGDKQLLQESQVYSIQFGQAVFTAWAQYGAA